MFLSTLAYEMDHILVARTPPDIFTCNNELLYKIQSFLHT